MKKAWVVRRDSEAVSPVIGTILLVAITVVLVAVIYVMVSGLTGTTHTPAVLILDTDSMENGYRVRLTEPTSDVKWGDVAIFFSDGVNTAIWSNLTTEDLTGSPSPVTWHYGSAAALGSLNIFLNITDLTGNGKMNRGDYLTFTTYSTPTFSMSTTYEITVLHQPTGGAMLSAPIT